MNISNHAKNRLEERYGFKSDEHIKAITSMFFHKPHFRTIEVTKKGSCIRQIRYKENDIQALINPIAKVIITIIPNTVIWQGNFEWYDKMCETIRQLKKAIKQKNNTKPIKKILKFGKFFIGEEI